MKIKCGLHTNFEADCAMCIAAQNTALKKLMKAYEDLVASAGPLAWLYADPEPMTLDYAQDWEKRAEKLLACSNRDFTEIDLDTKK